jgi:hypothetical protein
LAESTLIDQLESGSQPVMIRLSVTMNGQRTL